MIGWEPAVSVEVVKVAWPEALRATPEARIVAPSVKSTVPVVTGLPPLVTVAVNVTDWPTVDGLTEDVSTVAVAARCTTWVTEPLLGWNAGVPL